MATESSLGGGIGFLGVLCLLFIGLRLGGVIDWSWWWVLSPLWIPVAILATFCGFCLVMAAATGGFSRR